MGLSHAYRPDGRGPHFSREYHSLLPPRAPMAANSDHTGDILLWHELIAAFEARLGRSICGALMRSGHPCLLRPARGYRQCELHSGLRRWPTPPRLDV